MKQSWEDYGKAAEAGPMAFIVKIVIACFVIGVLISTIGYGLGWFGEAAQVAQKEFGPSAMLQKYEYFKDVAAQLDRKQVDITNYERRITDMNEMYKGDKRKEWAREDREQYNIWQSEIVGAKAGYNSLAADYNSQMSKFNWRFANVGELPQGASTPLPREFKPYAQ